LTVQLRTGAKSAIYDFLVADAISAQWPREHITVTAESTTQSLSSYSRDAEHVDCEALHRGWQTTKRVSFKPFS